MVHSDEVKMKAGKWIYPQNGALRQGRGERVRIYKWNDKASDWYDQSRCMRKYSRAVRSKNRKQIT